MRQGEWMRLLTLSTMKSIASTIAGSTFSDPKFPIIILFNTNDGNNQKIVAESWLLKMEVSVKVLHKINETTLGQFTVCSANFWARYPPKMRI